MRYKTNDELNKHAFWNFDDKKIIKANYDIFFTGVEGVLYPIDILNINKKYLNYNQRNNTWGWYYFKIF